MKKVLLLLCMFSLFVLAGCAKSSGIVPWADGAYSVTVDLGKSIVTSPSDAERRAIDEAQAFCSAQGQNMYMLRSIHKESWRLYTVRLQFRCGATSPESAIRKVDVEML